MCLYNRIHPNKKYQPNKKNGGIVPPFYDPRVLSVAIGCGNCIECRKQKAREWQVRLLEDIKTNTNGKFITLTFSNESIKKINKEIPETYKDKRNKEQPLIGYKRDNEIAIYATRHFLERWRKKYKKSVRHWLVTELGHKGTENIHLHGIIWTNELLDIKNIWNYGYVWDGYKKDGKIINYVSSRTVNYIVKYVSKIDQDHKYYKSKTLTSAGIGNNYITESKGQWTRNKYKGENTDEAYRTPSGHKINMPIYWRNKIYTEEEREQLWINKLNKQERWVCGEKINTSKGLEEYWKILAWHQNRSKQLGYGDDKINWKREEYEIKRRIYLLDKRIQNVGSAPDPELNMDRIICLREPLAQNSVKHSNKSETNKIWKQINSNINKINENK